MLTIGIDEFRKCSFEKPPYMKRVVSSSLISLAILLLVGAGFFYLQFVRNDQTSVYNAIPGDVAFVISTDPLSGDLKRLATSSFFNGADTVPVLQDYRKALLLFDSLSLHQQEIKSVFTNARLLVSGHVTGPSAFSLLFVMPASPELKAGAVQILKTLVKVDGADMIRSYNGTDIHEVKSGYGFSFTWAIAKGVFIGSTTPYLVEDALRQQQSSENPSPAIAISGFMEGKMKDMVVAIRYAGFSRWLRTQFREPDGVGLAGLERLGEWTLMRVEPHTNVISFDGQTMAEDSSSFLNLFNRQQPVERKLMDWLPAKTAGAVVWGASDMVQLIEDIRSFQADAGDKNQSSTLLPYFKNWIGTEVGLIVTQPVAVPGDNNYIAMISVMDSAKAERDLALMAGPEGQQEEKYNGYAIRYINRKGVMPALFGSLFKRVNRFYYTRINHHIVIANQAAVLRAYINDIRTGNLLTKQDRYLSLAARVPVRGNLFFYGSIPQSEKLFSSLAAPAWVKWLADYGQVLKNWNGLAFSVANNNGVLMTSGCLGYFDASSIGPQLAWNAKLDTTLRSGPFIPAGESGLVFAADISNQLYAFDASGNLKWKKKLETEMLSEVFAVDMYGNGQRQYLLSTHSFVYLLDSAGANCGNYPIRLPAEATTGISWYVPINGQPARYYISCSNLRLFAYELSGKPLSGFSTPRLPGIIVRPVYVNPVKNELILVDEGGTAFMMDMTGQRKYTFKGTVSLKEGTGFFQLGQDSSLIGFVSSENEIYNVNGEGTIGKMELPVSEDSVFSRAMGDLNGDGKADFVLAGNAGVRGVTADGVNLFRYRQDNRFEHTAIHQVRGKTYISAISEGRLYLFQQDGSLIDGFPLPGQSLPVTALTKEKSLLLLTLGGADNISLYLLP